MEPSATTTQVYYSILFRGLQLLWERKIYETMCTKAKGKIGYVYTPYITKKDGTRIYASQYGKKVFKIPKKK